MEAILQKRCVFFSFFLLSFIQNIIKSLYEPYDYLVLFSLFINHEFQASRLYFICLHEQVPFPKDDKYLPIYCHR